MAVRRGGTSGAEEVQQKIRAVAYQRWQDQGMHEGTALDDWLAAEAEVSAKPAPRKRAAVPRKKATPKT